MKCFVANKNDYPNIEWERYGFTLGDCVSAEVLFVGTDIVDDDYLQQFPSLKLIASRTTNRDNIVSKKVRVVFLEKKDVADIGSTAEFTINVSWGKIYPEKR